MIIQKIKCSVPKINVELETNTKKQVRRGIVITISILILCICVGLIAFFPHQDNICNQFENSSAKCTHFNKIKFPVLVSLPPYNIIYLFLFLFRLAFTLIKMATFDP